MTDALLTRDESRRHLLAPEGRVGAHRPVEQLDRDAPGLEGPNEPFHTAGLSLVRGGRVGSVSGRPDMRGDLMQQLLAGHLEAERDQVIGSSLLE
jgi:hypothetical protein